MVRTQISIFCILFLVIFLEAFIVPGIWSSLRVDLLMGMIIGVIISISFSHGLFFVMIASLLLQAFSGARPGLVPMIYLGTFIAVDLLKDVIYLENVLTQMVLGVILNALIAAALIVSLDIILTPQEIIPLAVGSLLTGMVTPVMVAIVCRLKGVYES